jgi:hypothetical protein
MVSATNSERRNAAQKPRSSRAAVARRQRRPKDFVAAALPQDRAQYIGRGRLPRVRVMRSTTGASFGSRRSSVELVWIPTRAGQ